VIRTCDIPLGWCACLYVSVGGAARSGSIQRCAGVWCNA